MLTINCAHSNPDVYFLAACYLHDSTSLSATKNAVATASGILHNVFQPAKCSRSSVQQDVGLSGDVALTLNELPHTVDQCCAACHAYNRAQNSSAGAASGKNCTAWTWTQDVFPLGYPFHDKTRYYNACTLYSSVQS